MPATFDLFYSVLLAAVMFGTRIEGLFTTTSTTFLRQNRYRLRNEMEIKLNRPRRRKLVTPRSIILFSHEDIEPYVGPARSFADMEGGIAIGELALNVFTGPSLVADGRGLFLCISDDTNDGDDDDDSSEEDSAGGVVEEIIIPQGTPLCGYARGYFSDKHEGDKSVGFLFAEDSSDETAVFYNKELMTLGDALRLVYHQRRAEGDGGSTKDLLFGHLVDIDTQTGRIQLRHDREFYSRIFIPEIGDKDQFTATSLGIYANDLAYNPDSDETQYLQNSEKNNILELVWRLALDQKTGMLVPTWPVVITRTDVRLLNTVPMEVGLQYGYNYWDAMEKERGAI